MGWGGGALAGVSFAEGVTSGAWFPKVAGSAFGASGAGSTCSSAAPLCCSASCGGLDLSSEDESSELELSQASSSSALWSWFQKVVISISPNEPNKSQYKNIEVYEHAKLDKKNSRDQHLKISRTSPKNPDESLRPFRFSLSATLALTLSTSSLEQLSNEKDLT